MRLDSPNPVAVIFASDENEPMSLSTLPVVPVRASENSLTGFTENVLSISCCAFFSPALRPDASAPIFMTISEIVAIIPSFLSIRIPHARSCGLPPLSAAPLPDSSIAAPRLSLRSRHLSHGGQASMIRNMPAYNPALFRATSTPV